MMEVDIAIPKEQLEKWLKLLEQSHQLQHLFEENTSKIIFEIKEILK